VFLGEFSPHKEEEEKKEKTEFHPPDSQKKIIGIFISFLTTS
jgi:hypothetical protein